MFYLGYYSVNTNRVRETMRVVKPPLDDLSDLGQYIQQECNDKTTYRLEKSTSRSKSSFLLETVRYYINMQSNDYISRIQL